MIKKLLLLFTCFVLLQTLNAQQAEKRFGFRAGVNVSNMDFSKGVPPTPTKTSWSTGINIGFLMSVPIINRLYFQPEYLYLQTGGKVKNSDSTYKFNYLSLPLLVRLQLHEKFSVLAGPQFDILINAKRSASGTSENITHDTEERGINAVAGVEYHFYSSFSLTARYIRGFNHIGLGQRSNLQEFKYQMLQVSVCARF
jgi:hypothetical protein